MNFAAKKLINFYTPDIKQSWIKISDSQAA